VDLQLLEALLPCSALPDTRKACVAVFSARGKQTWSPEVASQPHWPAIYRSSLEGLEDLGLATTVDEAARRVQDFVGRIERIS
jgi:hypothetical protein